MPRWFVGWVSRRYVAGPTLDDAVKVMKRLSKEGACFTIDVLGEEISTMEEAQFFLEEYQSINTYVLNDNYNNYYTDMFNFLKCDLYYSKIIIYDCSFNPMKILQYMFNILKKKNKTKWEKTLIQNSLRYNIIKIEKNI